MKGNRMRLVRLHSPNRVDCDRVERERVSPRVPGHRRFEWRDDQGGRNLERQDSYDSPAPCQGGSGYVRRNGAVPSAEARSEEQGTPECSGLSGAGRKGQIA